jgi:hypothetical protein
MTLFFCRHYQRVGIWWTVRSMIGTWIREDVVRMFGAGGGCEHTGSISIRSGRREFVRSTTMLR